ncbi:hypothetical protein KB206_02325 [Microvirga sp. STS02]|uniref:hypothetical protein n=1 Tax=Hymenobacter negativus TaxID=2795026 RepID=UPI0018DCA3B7|nr:MULTISPECIES: hypothetical protein [Bacteria]MBH8567702.1 hypothetical protein [Hymenobacter negativus]MBR7207436.1 hypothetical protein [Microvirga sp. STS02]
MFFSLLFPGRPAWFCQGLCLLLFALCSQPALAQVYYLDLSKQTLALPERAVYVEQVVDGRPGRPASVGTIYKGLDDKLVPVLFRQSLETDLAAWLRQQLPARPTDQPVLLCMRQLLVSEKATSTLLANNFVSNAELAFDVYAHRPDGYHFVRNVAAHSSNPGIAINTDHSLHMAQLMQQCLALLTATDLATAPQRPARSLAQALAAAPAGRPAVLRAAAPRRGVYFSAEQFVANQPDTTAQIQLDTVRWSSVRASILDPNAPVFAPTNRAARGYSRSVVYTPSGWQGTVQLKAKVRTATGDRVAARDVWGFSDGQQAYLRQASYYRLLGRQDAFYTFVGAAALDLPASHRRATGAPTSRPVAGGMRIDVSDESGEPVAFALDLRTGQTARFPPPGQPAHADTAYIYVYRPPGGPPTVQAVLLNDREVGQLPPGSFLELAWPHLGDVVRLSLGSPNGPALLLTPSTTVANYVKLRPGAAITPWQCVPAKHGEVEVDALEKRGK